MGIRLTWREICLSADYQGRWVALDNCRYERSATAPIEGDVVDADEDLATLCDRIREADRSRCSIVFCEEAEPASARRAPPSSGLRSLFR